MNEELRGLASMATKKLLKICGIVILLIFSLALIKTKLLPYYKFKNYIPKNGDLIFQSLPQNDLVLAIEGISESPYSHCGIVVYKNSSWMVLEAIGHVKYTPLYEWVQRGRKEAFSVYRLKGNKDLKPFIAEAAKFLGKPYDSRYRLDDEKIYCSELIYKSYVKSNKVKLGKLKALGDMPWEAYKKTIRKYENGPPPLERLMITPKNLSLAPELELFYKQNYD